MKCQSKQTNQIFDVFWRSRVLFVDDSPYASGYLHDGWWLNGQIISKFRQCGKIRHLLSNKKSRAFKLMQHARRYPITLSSPLRDCWVTRPTAASASLWLYGWVATSLHLSFRVIVKCPVQNKIPLLVRLCFDMTFFGLCIYKISTKWVDRWRVRVRRGELQLSTCIQCNKIAPFRGHPRQALDFLKLPFFQERSGLQRSGPDLLYVYGCEIASWCVWWPCELVTASIVPLMKIMRVSANQRVDNLSAMNRLMMGTFNGPIHSHFLRDFKKTHTQLTEMVEGHLRTPTLTRTQVSELRNAMASNDKFTPHLRNGKMKRVKKIAPPSDVLLCTVYLLV